MTSHVYPYDSTAGPTIPIHLQHVLPPASANPESNPNFICSYSNEYSSNYPTPSASPPTIANVDQSMKQLTKATIYVCAVPPDAGSIEFYGNLDPRPCSPSAVDVSSSIGSVYSSSTIQTAVIGSHKSILSIHDPATGSAASAKPAHPSTPNPTSTE